MIRKSVVKIFVLAIALTLVSACSSKPAGKAKKTSKQVDTIVATNVRLASIYLQRNQLNFAQEKASQALKADPNSSHANNMMALLQWRLKQYGEAEKYFRRAVKLRSSNSSALNNYGAFLCDRGEIDRSLQYFDRAAENPLYKKPSQPLTNAGRCLLKKPDAKKAEVYFRRALRFNRSEPEALLQMAKLSYQSDRMLTARGFMQRYLNSGKKLPRVCILRFG